jgi:hypothetical protein
MAMFRQDFDLEAALGDGRVSTSADAQTLRRLIKCFPRYGHYVPEVVRAEASVAAE